MCYLKYVFEGLVAVGTIAVAILAIWGDWFRNKCASPKLIIEPYNLRGNITNIKKVHDIETANSIRAIYYHLKVINLRKWAAAKNCQVVLKGIHRKGPDGDFHPYPLVVPIQYVWSPAEWASIHQNISQDAILDFGYVTEGGNLFIPSLYVMPNNFMGLIGPKMSVRYTLQIVADNYTANNKYTYEVSWDGNFSDNPDIMARSLIIKEI